MSVEKIGVEPLWAVKLAGDAIADEAVRRRYFAKLATAASRISSIARENSHRTRQSTFSPVWDHDPSCVFDVVLANTRSVD